MFDREPSGDLVAGPGRRHGRIAFEAYGRVFAADDRTACSSLQQGPRRGRALLRLRRAHGGAGEDRLAPGVLERRPARGPHGVLQQPLHVDSVRALARRTGSRTGSSSTIRDGSSSTWRRRIPSRFTATASGALVYYVFAGPTPRDVLAQYTELTGRISLPPLWALGNQQSKWGYMDADEVRAIARGYRDRGIPCDVVYLDIDHMDGYRVFTFDAERFPDPRGVRGRAGGRRVQGRVHHRPGREGRRGLRRLRRPAASATCTARPSAAPSTATSSGRGCARSRTSRTRRHASGGATSRRRSSTRAWRACGATWTSRRCSCPTSRRCPGTSSIPGGGERALPQGRPQPVRLADGAGGARGPAAAAAGQAAVRDHPRRATPGCSGDALQWTGDNSSWWEHLWMSMPQLQNLGLSGVSFCGVDVGGFFGDSDGELLARWTEFGIFQPFCRNHSCKGTVPQEPWAFGEPWETVCREMLDAADAAAAVPVRAVRRGGADRRADPAPAAVRVSRRSGRPTAPTTSSWSATRCWWRRSRGPGSSTATSTCRPARGCSGGRASGSRDRPTCSRTRRSAGRRSTRGRTPRSRCGPCCSTRASSRTR